MDKPDPNFYRDHPEFDGMQMTNYDPNDPEMAFTELELQRALLQPKTQRELAMDAEILAIRRRNDLLKQQLAELPPELPPQSPQLTYGKGLMLGGVLGVLWGIFSRRKE